MDTTAAYSGDIKIADVLKSHAGYGETSCQSRPGKKAVEIISILARAAKKGTFRRTPVPRGKFPRYARTFRRVNRNSGRAGGIPDTFPARNSTLPHPGRE